MYILHIRYPFSGQTIEKLKPIKHSKVFGFVFYMPPIQDYQTRIHDFHQQYSDLGRVYL